MKHSVFILSALLLLSCGSRQEKKTKSLDYAAFANALEASYDPMEPLPENEKQDQ